MLAVWAHVLRHLFKSRTKTHWCRWKSTGHRVSFVHLPSNFKTAVSFSRHAIQNRNPLLKLVKSCMCGDANVLISHQQTNVSTQTREKELSSSVFAPNFHSYEPMSHRAWRWILCFYLFWQFLRGSNLFALSSLILCRSATALIRDDGEAVICYIAVFCLYINPNCWKQLK